MISLKKRHEFLHVRQQGKKLVTKSFIIQGCLSTDNLNPTIPRFGFIVTKKNGNAVQRNLIKRRFRALIRDHLKKDNIMALDYVLISRPGCAEEPFQNLKQMVEWAFKKYKSLFEIKDS